MKMNKEELKNMVKYEGKEWMNILRTYLEVHPLNIALQDNGRITPVGIPNITIQPSILDYKIMDIGISNLIITSILIGMVKKYFIDNFNFDFDESEKINNVFIENLISIINRKTHVYDKKEDVDDLKIVWLEIFLIDFINNKQCYTPTQNTTQMGMNMFNAMTSGNFKV